MLSSLSLVAAGILLGLPNHASAQTYSASTYLEPRTAQLPHGETEGNFRCDYTRAVAFTAEAAYPVKLSITAGGEAVASVIVSDEAPVSISADLPPGGYILYAEPLSAKDGELYWGVYDAKFEIDERGVLKEQNGGRTTLVHMRKVELLWPARNEEIPELRPTLRWKPLPEAARYEISWFESASPDKIPVGRGQGTSLTPEFTFPEDVAPARRYAWSVNAHDETGRRIGYYSSGYFFTHGGEALFQQTPVPTDGSRLGIVPMPSLREASPGIAVSHVFPESPASRSGFKVGDVLTSFDGTGLSEMSIPAFVRLVRTTGANRPVEIVFVRDGAPQKIKVTLDRATGN